MWVTMEWMSDILEWTERLSSSSMGRGWTGLAAIQLVPGIAVWEGFVTEFPVDPPTASTRANIGIWKSSWVVEKVLQSSGTW